MLKIILSFFAILSLSSASLAMSKKPKNLENQGQKKPMSPKFSGKANAFFQTKITEVDNGNGDITLIAQVVPRKDMSSGEFMWVVPDSVKVVSGDKKGATGYESGEAKQFTLVIDKSTVKEGDLFRFFAYEMTNGERLGGGSSFVYSNEKQSPLQKKSLNSKKKRIFQ